MANDTITSITSAYPRAVNAYNRVLRNIAVETKLSDRIPVDTITISNQTNQTTSNNATYQGYLENNFNNISNKSSNYQQPGAFQQSSSLVRHSDIINNHNEIKESKIPFSFEDLLKITKKKFDTFYQAEQMANAALADNIDMVSLMAAMNEAEIVLQQVVTIRDKFVNSLLEILKTPL